MESGFSKKEWIIFILLVVFLFLPALYIGFDLLMKGLEEQFHGF